MAGPDSEDISVSVRTTELGQQQAVRTGDADMSGYGTFASAMAGNDAYLGVRALLQSDRTLSTVSESVDIDSCTGQKTFNVPAGTVRAGPVSSTPPPPSADGALLADGTPDPVRAKPATPPVSGTDAQEPPAADPAPSTENRVQTRRRHRHHPCLRPTVTVAVPERSHATASVSS